MPKRKETIELEEALIKNTREKRIYGCEEITIGFYNGGHGNEIVDFMTMDSHGIIKCYEIKVTKQDLVSSAKKSWYGNYNYLVVSNELYSKIKDNIEDYIPNHVGVLVGEYLESVKRAKHIDISLEDSIMLKESLIRSMYFKINKYKDSKSVDKMKQLKSELYEAQKDRDLYSKRACDAELLIRCYERYKRYNKQKSDFLFEDEVEKEHSKFLKKKKDSRK